MNSEELRSQQAPLKEKYRESPGEALITLRAEGQLGEGIACSVSTGKALVEAGLHPATGGSGLQACSGDMLPRRWWRVQALRFQQLQRRWRFLW